MPTSQPDRRQDFMIEAGMLPKGKAMDLRAKLIAPLAFTLK